MKRLILSNESAKIIQMNNFRNFYKNKYVLIGVSVVVFIGLLAGSFYFGYREGEKNPQNLIISGVANLNQGKLEAVDFSVFWDVWQTIKNKYVGASNLNNQDLVYGAISGLLGALKDPYSVFMPPSDATKFNQDISGEFSGIGARIDVKDGQLLIVAPLKDSPAEKAGLRAMDAILKIDDKDTAGIIVDDAVKLIRGANGTIVTLTILRTGWAKPKDISITRSVIQVPTIDAKTFDGNIAYIHLYNFYEQAPIIFYQTAMKLAAQDTKGVILDLRDNPGGYLDGAVNIAGWFLKPGEKVVSEEFASSSQNHDFFSYGSGLFKNTQMVILMNGGSASASEILIGAIKDNRNVKLIGEKTFGKGTVQELETLRDGSMVKITVAHWRMPAGELIDKSGIEPDYKVSLTDDDIKAVRDPQLDKALEVLKSQIK